LDNFEQVRFFAATRKSRSRGGAMNKGQSAELSAFVAALQSGGPMPISFDDLLDTTVATLAVSDSLRQGRAVSLSEYWVGLD